MSTKEEGSNCAKSDRVEFVPRKGPVIGCVSVIVGWLVFILAYALYWSGGFDLFQNAVVTIVSLATAGLLMGGVMLAWYHPNGELRRKNSRDEVDASSSGGSHYGTE